MNWFDYLKNKLTPTKANNAGLAKERLQVIVSHERNTRKGPDYLPDLQREILAVISKYIEVDLDKVHVNCNSQAGTSKLELNLVLPNKKKPTQKQQSKRHKRKASNTEKAL